MTHPSFSLNQSKVYALLALGGLGSCSFVPRGELHLESQAVSAARTPPIHEVLRTTLMAAALSSGDTESASLFSQEKFNTINLRRTIYSISLQDKAVFAQALLPGVGEYRARQILDLIVSHTRDRTECRALINLIGEEALLKSGSHTVINALASLSLRERFASCEPPILAGASSFSNGVEMFLGYLTELEKVTHFSDSRDSAVATSHARRTINYNATYLRVEAEKLLRANVDESEAFNTLRYLSTKVPLELKYGLLFVDTINEGELEAWQRHSSLANAILPAEEKPHYRVESDGSTTELPQARLWTDKDLVVTSITIDRLTQRSLPETALLFAERPPVITRCVGESPEFAAVANSTGQISVFDLAFGRSFVRGRSLICSEIGWIVAHELLHVVMFCDPDAQHVISTYGNPQEFPICQVDRPKGSKEDILTLSDGSTYPVGVPVEYRGRKAILWWRIACNTNRGDRGPMVGIAFDSEAAFFPGFDPGTGSSHIPVSWALGIARCDSSLAKAPPALAKMLRVLVERRPESSPGLTREGEK